MSTLVTSVVEETKGDRDRDTGLAAEKSRAKTFGTDNGESTSQPCRRYNCQG